MGCGRSLGDWPKAPGATRHSPYFPYFPHFPYLRIYPIGKIGKYGKCEVAPGLVARFGPGRTAATELLNFIGMLANNSRAARRFPYFLFTPRLPHFPYFPNFSIGKL